MSGNSFSGDIPGANHWGNIFQTSSSRVRSFDVSNNNYTASPAWLKGYGDVAGLTIRPPIPDVADPSSTRGISKFMLAVVLIGVSSLTVTGVVVGVRKYRKNQSRGGAREFVFFQNDAVDVEMASRDHQ